MSNANDVFNRPPCSATPRAAPVPFLPWWLPRILPWEPDTDQLPSWAWTDGLITVTAGRAAPGIEGQTQPPGHLQGPLFLGLGRQVPETEA